MVGQVVERRVKFALGAARRSRKGMSRNGKLWHEVACLGCRGLACRGQ